MASQPENSVSAGALDSDNLCVSVEDPKVFPEYATEAVPQQDTTADTTLRHSLVRDLLPPSDSSHDLGDPPVPDSLEPEAAETKRKRKVTRDESDIQL